SDEHLLQVPRPKEPGIAFQKADDELEQFLVEILHLVASALDVRIQGRLVCVKRMYGRFPLTPRARIAAAIDHSTMNRQVQFFDPGAFGPNQSREVHYDTDGIRRVNWRLGSESNRRRRLCRPLHDHSAT